MLWPTPTANQLHRSDSYQTTVRRHPWRRAEDRAVIERDRNTAVGIIALMALAVWITVIVAVFGLQRLVPDDAMKIPAAITVQLG